MNIQQKGSAAIVALIVIVLIIAGGGSYLYITETNSQKQEKQENLQTSTNTDSASPLVSNYNSNSITANQARDASVTQHATANTQTATNLLECSDTTCFTQAIQTCSRARYQSNNTVEFLGSNIQSKVNFALSQSNNQCYLSVKLLEYTISPSQAMLNSIQGAQVVGMSTDAVYSNLNNEMRRNYIGKTGVCTITNHTTDMLDTFNNDSGVFLIVDPDRSICSGELFKESV